MDLLLENIILIHTFVMKKEERQLLFLNNENLVL